MKKVLILIGGGVLAVMAILILSRTFESLDVVGKDSVRAFDELLRKAQMLVSEDKESGRWSIVAPDSGARFSWGGEYTEQAFDVILEIYAAPFVDAGLDISKLPDAIAYNDGILIIGAKLAPEGSAAKTMAKSTPLAAYERIVNFNKDAIGYHAALDHYGINIGGGNMFEWAKDLGTNDNDMVFVLNPEPFINAGVIPDKIDGWTFAKVTVDDEFGKPIQVDKILKPFNLD
jgi:hypothetical protein